MLEEIVCPKSANAERLSSNGRLLRWSSPHRRCVPLTAHSHAREKMLDSYSAGHAVMLDDVVRDQAGRVRQRHTLPLKF